MYLRNYLFVVHLIFLDTLFQQILQSVKCHVCKSWGYYATLWGSLFRRKEFSIEHISAFEPFA